MPETPRYWLYLPQDPSEPSGGIKQAHRLVEALSREGRKATIVQSQARFHPGWFSSRVATTSLAEFKSNIFLHPSHDVLLLQETLLPLLPTLKPGIPKVIFNQNGSYSFGTTSKRHFFPADPKKVIALYHHPELLHVLCISEHDERLLQEGFALPKDRISRLVNGIETDLFRPSGKKILQAAFMPRKHPRDAAIVKALLQCQPWFRPWSLVSIDGLSQQQVASTLQRSLVFLAFGHPEGFGLPLAEAAACGCQLIGYSGLGGREVMHLTSRHRTSEEVAFGDWCGFVSAFRRFQERFEGERQKLLEDLLRSSRLVRRTYSIDAMQTSVRRALPRLERIPG